MDGLYTAKKSKTHCWTFHRRTILEIDPLQMEQLILHLMPGTHHHHYFVKSKLLISREIILGKMNKNCPPKWCHVGLPVQSFKF